MASNVTRSWDWLLHVAKRLFLSCAVMGMALATVEPAAAQSGGAKVVRSDGGGWLSQRSAEIRQLRATGQRVELRGTCLSACTMYLALPNVCVDRSASFGFHGPTRNGQNLPAHEFEHWSGVMADTYREPLRSWYLTEARYRTTGYYQVSGSELINMGYPQC